MSHAPEDGGYRPQGIAGKLGAMFINSKLTPIVVIASILLGLFSVFMLPREEEPQIKVPMIDVMVTMPGATPQEVQQRLTIPMEKLLYELPGVEYIYSTSMAGASTTVRRMAASSGRGATCKGRTRLPKSTRTTANACARRSSTR